MMKTYLDIWMICIGIYDNEIGALILGTDEAEELQNHFGPVDGKEIVAALLRDVKNDPSKLKYLEDDAEILTEFGPFKTGIFKIHWKQEIKLDATERNWLFMSW
eukprot:snap_masked-scaffold_51-processed-gene-1.54-mRNA-1 protein AED:1.00 eAED:1.00 QI:0/0/0/0/1/1/2/0/103